MFKAVLFDLDNTLIDRDACFRACLPEGAEAELLALDQGGHGDREALLQAWRRYAPIDQRQLSEALAARLRPDESLLEVLRSLPSAAVVSNGSGATQRSKLRAAGLDAVFPADRIFISGELGIAKPDPEILLRAAGALGFKPEDCLFLGDQERVDGGAAQAAGVQFHRVESPLSGPSLRQLLERL